MAPRHHRGLKKPDALRMGMRTSPSPFYGWLFKSDSVRFLLSSSIMTVKPISMEMKNENIIWSSWVFGEGERGNGSCW